MAANRFLIICLLVAAGSVATVPFADAFAKASDSSKAGSSASNKKTASKTTAKPARQASSTSSKKRTSAAVAAKRQEAIFSALVVNAENGQILYEKNASSLRYPASLTKMMTLYLTFEALKQGKITLDERLPVSAKAASQPQTNISLEEGDSLPVKSAIESLVVRSANDSAMVLAEALGGTEWNFALNMTKKARELGMKDTIFRNPSGLPDDKQYTNAYDMARLGIALRRDFPEYYPYFKLKSFSWNGITYPGHNHVMNKYPGVDGIKTGFIRASGYNLVTSASKGGHKLVAVVMGGSSVPNRDNRMMDLLDSTFASLERTDNSVASAVSKPEALQVENSSSLALSNAMR